MIKSVEGQTASVGPWGGQSGHTWYDGMYHGKADNYSDGSHIESIQIGYDKNFSSVWFKQRGGKGGKNFDKVHISHCQNQIRRLLGCTGRLVGQSFDMIVAIKQEDSSFRNFVLLNNFVSIIFVKSIIIVMIKESRKAQTKIGPSTKLKKKHTKVVKQ